MEIAPGLSRINKINIGRGKSKTTDIVQQTADKMDKVLPDMMTARFLNQTFMDKGIIWFINMRWLAAAGVITAIIFSQYILGLLPSEISLYLWAGAGILLISNLCFWGIRNKIHNIHDFILLQMISDLFVLTYLLHFSGGIENPLLVLYVFHIMIAGILLSRRDAYIISSLTAILLLCLTFGEYLEGLQHYTIKIFPHQHLKNGETTHAAHNLSFVLGFSSAFTLLLFGTAYFTTTIMERLRLSQQKLIDAERLAVMGQVTAYIAHEVNNPISIISSKAKLALSAKDGQLSGKIRETLEVIDKYSDRIASVVKGLLNLLRPHQSIQMSPLNINKVISESLNFVEVRLHQARIELEKALDWTIPPIFGRFYEMSQVILNIVNNAIDAMPEGGKIKIETGLSGNEKIEVVISDTGPGISRENRGNIFAPFFSTKPDGKGTGLGLSMSRAVVKTHGGDIQAESRVGRGTKFVITLPAAEIKKKIKD